MVVRNDRNASKYSPQGCKQGIDQQIFLPGNQFHVKLHILSPEICKQCLRVKSWEAKVRAEKQRSLKTKWINLNKLRQLKTDKCVFPKELISLEQGLHPTTRSCVAVSLVNGRHSFLVLVSLHFPCLLFYVFVSSDQRTIRLPRQRSSIQRWFMAYFRNQRFLTISCHSRQLRWFCHTQLCYVGFSDRCLNVWNQNLSLVMLDIACSRIFKVYLKKRVAFILHNLSICDIFQFQTFLSATQIWVWWTPRDP